MVALAPASGAFVSLSQASAMDAAGGEHDRAMARWTLAGSLGAVAGPAALALAPPAAKLPLLAALGLVASGWYAIPKARLYDALPGRSSEAVVLTNVSGLAGRLVPLALGGLAAAVGLGAAMWLLLLGPVALLVLVPRRRVPWRASYP